MQRSVQVPKDIWNAAKCIPGGRTKFIVEALANAVSAYKTELPKLRMEVNNDKDNLRLLEAVISAKEARIKELESLEETHLQEVMQVQKNLDQAVIETSRLLKSFRKDLNKSHFSRLSELSNTPARDIERFIKEMRYRPTDEQIQEFFLR